MPQTRDMVTSHVARRSATHRSPAFPKPFFCRTGTVLGLLLLASPSPLLACSVCFGQPDSDLAQGLNAGVLALFSIVAAVLGGFAAFFVYMAKRSRTASSVSAPERERVGVEGSLAE